MPSQAQGRSSASDETSVPTDPREGRQFGWYRVLRRLGSGGMGHVYLALDTRLGRHAALKFLPPDLLSNKNMLNRLQQEARTASALNHPNILTIYEIGEFAGELFIASEFVEGVTLKKAIANRAIDPDMAIRIAAQIASALAAAHSAGVVHRDLKPANVMLRPDGYVKVIDFGLAKIASESRQPSGGSGWSLPGAVVGTVDYMSPEQARGDEVDGRTDLWSLGVLLYEMLSNQRPFAGETDSHVIVAILDRPAPPLPHVGSLPAGLGTIVARALSKDPARRYQSAHKLLADLEQLDTSSMRLHPARPLRTERGNSHRHAYIALALAGVLLASSGLWWWLFGGKDLVLGPDWFRLQSVRQVTFNGRTLLSAISPDGKYLAFVVGDSGGMQSLHLKQVDQPSDEVRIPTRKIDYIGLTFSPDSRAIYEVEEEYETKRGKLFAVPLVGERPSRPVLEDIDGPVSFSSDGKRFAFMRWEHPAAPRHGPTRSLIEVADPVEARAAPFFATDSFTIFRQLTWSPKGDQIAAVIDDTLRHPESLALGFFTADHRYATRSLPHWNSVGQLFWDRDGRSLLLSASAESEPISRSQLRQLAFATGETHDLTRDLSGYGALSATQDRNLLAAVKKDARPTIWISASGDLTHGQSILSELQEGATLAWFNPNQLLVYSSRTGFPNLAVLNIDSQSESIFTEEHCMEQNAAAFPGGDSVVYSSNRSGTFHIWRYDRQTNRYRQLTFGSSYDDKPVISPDGKWIVYTAWSSNTPALYKVSSEGGPAQALSSYAATDPHISPDGHWVACRIQSAREHWFVGLIPFDGKGRPRAVAGVYLPFQWSPAGDSLTTSVSTPNGIANLWRVPVDGSAPLELTDFDDDQSIVTFAWSPEGNRLACLRVARNSDVVLFKRAK